MSLKLLVKPNTCVYYCVVSIILLVFRTYDVDPHDTENTRAEVVSLRGPYNPHGEIGSQESYNDYLEKKENTQ